MRWYAHKGFAVKGGALRAAALSGAGGVLRPRRGLSAAERRMGHAEGWGQLHLVELAEMAGGPRCCAYVRDMRRGGWRMWTRASAAELLDTLRAARLYAGCSLRTLSGRPVDALLDGAVVQAVPPAAAAAAVAAAGDAPSRRAVKRARVGP